MKKIARWTFAGLLVVAFAAPAAGAEKGQDLKVIKKAVRENPGYRSGREVTRFNLEVRDARAHKETVRITLPLAVFDFVLKCAANDRLRFDDCDIDIRGLFEELKKAGPMSLIEIQDGHSSFKVWLD
ncbi:MAG: hypothetical protein Q8O91_08895 [Candidatus Aminicenantes bacterium]|nr:hypothetical protein [Candidatus Aminicenantes bacterium]